MTSPIFIVSKGRHEYMLTSKALTEMRQPHFIVVEPQEVDAYKAAIKRFSLLTEVVELDMSYKEKYELCDDLGLSKSTGSGPARNFAWDTAIALGYDWHWVMDDNIRGFFMAKGRVRINAKSRAIFQAMEDFSQRYTNVSMAGPNYSMNYVPSDTEKKPPFTTNTKCYSCNLIRNDVPFRWRGRYNEDVILTLDMLKAGWCTIQFFAFLQNKMATQTMKGGNTDEIYKGKKVKGEKYARGGTTEKSRMLERVHPDVAKVIWRYGRVHHYVNYGPFKKNKLIKKEGIEIKDNNYGLRLIDKRTRQPFQGELR